MSSDNRLFAKLNLSFLVQLPTKAVLIVLLNLLIIHSSFSLCQAADVAKFQSSISKNAFDKKITLYPHAVFDKPLTWVHLEATHETNQGNGHIVVTSNNATMSNDDWVETITFDIILDQDIHFMKIDVEGLECHVLKGAQHLMTRRQTHYIAIEFSDATRTNPTCDAYTMLETMIGMGYLITDIILPVQEGHNTQTQTSHNMSLLDPKFFVSFPPNIQFTLDI